MTTNFSNRPPRSKVRLPLWVFVLLAVLLLIFVVGSSVFLFRSVRGLVSSYEATDPDFAIVEEPVSEAVISENPTPENNVSGISLPAIDLASDSFERWSGNERVTILMLGIDQRCDEEGPTHTDSMMLVTIDPVGLSAGIMSLPRDLWVEIPGFDIDRINQAHYYGEAYEYPGGGPALAVETVESFLGIQIDYFAAVNFDAFIEVVNEIGGIDMNVPEAIEDDTYPDRCYGYDPFQIDAGEHQLDGEMALKYARTRATLGSDVDRAGRQQAVLLAVRDKILSLDMVPQLIARAPEIWRTLQANVRTNMTPEEAIQLALLVQDIPRESIKTAVIDYDYVYPETTPDGRQVLVPNRESIRELRNDLFTPPVVPTPEIKNLPALMAAEEARVAIKNGTAEFGLASTTQAYLLAQGVDITEVGNADSSTYRTTQIIDYGNHPNTTRYLIQLMGIPPLNVTSGDTPEGDYDMLVIIGSDWAVPGQ